MQNKVFTIILVVIVVAFLGVTVVTKNSGPNMSRVLQSQENTVEILSRLENKLSDSTVTKQDLTNVYNTLNDLTRRIVALELKTANSDNQPSARPQPPQEDYTKRYDIPLAHSVIRGKEDAPVTIVEFVDFQCPFCARFHSMVNQVLEAYPNDVNYVLKHFPLSFHPQARPAAKAVMAAGEQGKFYEMAEKILEDNSNLSPELFERFAKDLGLDVERFRKDITEKDAQWEQIIQDDMTLGGNVEVRGTPTFYLDSRKTRARDFNSMKQEIEAILSAQ